MDEFDNSAQALHQIVKIYELAHKTQYTLRIYIDDYDGKDEIKYTLYMTSNTHNCVELRQKIINYRTDSFIPLYRVLTSEMEESLHQHEKMASIKTFTDA